MKINSVSLEEKSKHCKKCDQETNHTVSVGTKKVGLMSMAIDQIPGMDVIDVVKNTVSSGNYAMKALELSVCSVCDTKVAKKVTDEVYSELMMKRTSNLTQNPSRESSSVSEATGELNNVVSEATDELKGHVKEGVKIVGGETGIIKLFFSMMFKVAKWVIIIGLAVGIMMMFLG